MSVEIHVLASGSDGNCIVVKSSDGAVMVDAGLGYKKTKSLMDLSGLDASDVKALLITHEHSDHVGGAGPVSRKLHIPVMCNEQTFSAFPDIGEIDYSPISMMNFFNVSGMDIIALPTSHDAVEPCSYFFMVEDKKILIATDTGKLTYPIEQALAEADVAIIESNYDKRMLDNGDYPAYLKKLIGSDIGHMCNVATGEAIKRTIENSQRKIFLAHLSKNNNTPDIARDTVSKISGISRMKIDCLEFPGDTRVIRV